MARFKKIRGIKLPYEKQGMIFFLLANYNLQPMEVRERIDSLIRDICAGELAYEKALRAWLIKGKGFEACCAEFYVNGATLVKLRKKLYENW